MDKTCEYCKWHESYSGACFNADSPYVADFTTNDSWCEEWEQNENTEVSELPEENN